MLALTESDVRAVLPMSDLIDTMHAALAEFSGGRVRQPLRTIIEVGKQAFFGVMPAFIPGNGALGTKLVTLFASNADLGIPTHLATILLLDSETGALQAVMDGRYITEARTAAVSAVSTKLLARPDAATLALIGSGVQARSHVEAIAHVRPLREIRVWSPTPAHREDFAREAAALTTTPVRACQDARTAVAGADVVALVSASREPVVRNGWIADGTHICAVGACRPDQREMDTELVRRSRLFVDSRAGALSEAGDVVLPIKEGAFGADHIAGELGELAAAQVGGRSSASEVTLFKSLGMAVEDVAAAQLVYRRALERGLGTQISV